MNITRTRTTYPSGEVLLRHMQVVALAGFVVGLLFGLGADTAHANYPVLLLIASASTCVLVSVVGYAAFLYVRQLSHDLGHGKRVHR